MVEQFIDRGDVVSWLEEQVEEHGLAVLYGRRRVGKTAAIEYVLDGRDAVYFLADQRPERQNIESLQKAMAELVEEELFAEAEFEGWEELFEAFLERVETAVVAIDEFPYLIEGNDAVPSIFQRIWDELLEDEPVALILCGSSVSMMETHVLDYKSPLYGRRTGQWKLEPFTFPQLQEFFPGHSLEDRLRFYSFLDGIPAYLLKMRTDRSVAWNLTNRVMKQGAYLYEEADYLLRQELRQPANYFTILQAIAEGNTRFGQVANRTGLPTSTVSQYLKNLRQLHVVEAEYPVTQSKEGRNALYRLSDNYYSFWFEVVYPNKGMVEQGRNDELYRKSEEKLLHRAAEAFEQVCRQLTWNLYDVEDVGRWWRDGHEIDVAAVNSGEEQLVLGECKWTESPVGVSLLRQLEDEAELVRWGGEDRGEQYALFSRAGFTSEMEETAESRDDVELYTLARIEESVA